MKAKSNIPEVMKPPQAAPQAEPREPLYKGLSSIERLVPFLGGSDTYPSADDCENMNRDAFNTARSLVELVTWGEEAFENEVGTATEPTLTCAAEGITLQLEMMRLASKTLFEQFQGDTFARKPR
jgi:hypothetical protein